LGVLDPAFVILERLELGVNFVETVCWAVGESIGEGVFGDGVAVGAEDEAGAAGDLFGDLAGAVAVRAVVTVDLAGGVGVGHTCLYERHQIKGFYSIMRAIS